MNFFTRFAVIALLCFSAMQVHAQPYPGPGQSLVCKSSGYQQNYCAADTRGGVTLMRQISSSSCTQSRTWGYDRRGVWVTQGCEGEFLLGQPVAVATSVVRCQSNDYHQNYCGVDTRGGVRLQKQISNSACERGRTWGYDAGGIWVGDGCKGDFAVGGGWDAGAPPPPSVFVAARPVRCESVNGATVRCNMTIYSNVRMVTQLSTSGCYQSRTWGYDRNGIWVSNGCRADFEVDGYRQ